MLTRTLIAARGQLRKTIVQMSNQIRGLMKTFGLIVPKGAGSVFEGHVRRLLAGEAALAQIMLPLLEAWRSLRSRAVDLDRQLIASARKSEASRLLMSIPGVGAVTASSYVAAIEVQIVALGRRMARAYNQALPVRRGGLWRPYLAPGRRSSVGSPLRGGNDDPHAGGRQQCVARLGSEAARKTRVQARNGSGGEEARRHHA